MTIGALMWLPASADAQVAVGTVTHAPRVHDPCIVEQDGTFYVYSTGRNLPFYSSTDLYNWTRAGTVFEANPQWALKAVPGVKNPWAPDVSFFHGSYHLYYSMSTFGSNRSSIGLATSPTLDQKAADYKWTDQGEVFHSTPRDDFNAIDPNLIVDEAQTPWLVLGSCWGGVRLRQLDAETGKPTRLDTQVYPLATRPGGKLIEAPFLIRHGKHYYLFVSFDACCRGVDSTYKVMVGRSTKITGPYVDADGTPMMRGGGTLVVAGQGDTHGPGHNGVLQNALGHDWMAHHFYDGADAGRSKLQVRQLGWDKLGWPLAGEPVTAPVKVARPGPVDLRGDWRLSLDFADEKQVHFDGPGAAGKWSSDGGKPRVHAGDGFDTTDCVVADDGTWFTGRTPAGRLLRGRKV